jgi:UDP-N-acetylglucosamine 2-epimerase (non-hydrolysing)
LNSTIAVVFGTRPEIIKLGPLINLLGPSARLIHTGQHFDRELSELILDDLNVSKVAQTLEVGGSTRAQQIGQAVIKGESAVSGCKAIVVQGDTNSALAGAIVANALEVPLFHVEAGLRSHDRRMPEEHNRVLIDHLADMCWAPTQGNVDNLLAEGVSDHRIELTGNSVLEALESVLPTEVQILDLLSEMDLVHREFVLTTLHRPENVDDPAHLEAILKSLTNLQMPVVFPMHPRTRATIVQAGLDNLVEGMRVVSPLTYKNFLSLLASCAVAISDSGGVQEEVSVLKVPLVVLRRSTERPEVLGTFATITEDPIGMYESAAKVLADVQGAFERLASIPSPFGDGHASERMIASLERFGIV